MAIWFSGISFEKIDFEVKFPEEYFFFYSGNTKNMMLWRLQMDMYIDTKFENNMHSWCHSFWYKAVAKCIHWPNHKPNGMVQF